jgi:hypothetical protein
LDLSGRNAWLARPLFHPLVAHREHFSQRCPALPQHFVQDHSHRGLCNRESLSHRDFYSRPLPAALDFLPPPPPPGPTPTPARRLHRPRVVSFARDYFFSSFLFFSSFFLLPSPPFFLSLPQTEIEVARYAALRAPGNLRLVLLAVRIEHKLWPIFLAGLYLRGIQRMCVRAVHRGRVNAACARARRML